MNKRQKMFLQLMGISSALLILSTFLRYRALESTQAQTNTKSKPTTACSVDKERVVLSLGKFHD
jgi:hypothetical protein